MSWDEVHDVQQPSGYNQPPEDGFDDWDAYEQKKEELLNDVWEMSVGEFEQEMDGYSHHPNSGSGGCTPDNCPAHVIRLGKILRRAVDSLAQERLEAYIADNSKGDY